MGQRILIYVGDEDLRVIDARAAASKMSRSSFVVAMALHGDARLLEAIGSLRRELARFEADNRGWQVELDRLHKRVDLMRRAQARARELIQKVITGVQMPKSYAARLVEAMAKLDA